MSRNFSHIANDHFRRLLNKWLVRGARQFGSGIVNLGHGNESEARGLRLLREWLSPEQLAQYNAYRYFDVTGCHSGKRYRIRHGTATNILNWTRMAAKVGWCFVPRDMLVAGDVMLAQKIALETDEGTALAVAGGLRRDGRLLDRRERRRSRPPRFDRKRP